MRRVVIETEPFIDKAKFKAGWAWSGWGNWPTWWIDHPERPLETPSVAVFRLNFKLEKAATLRFHVSADNRYRIFLDASSFGRGPERGDAQHWFFESYEGDLAAGEHVLAVQTWWLGEKAPFAQMSVRPAFMLAAEGEWMERLSTGHAEWEAALMPGIEFIPPGDAWGTGHKTRVNGCEYPWDWESGAAKLEWRKPQRISEAVSSAWKNEIRPYWMLMPAALPPMIDEPASAGILRYLSEGISQYPVSAQRHLASEAREWEDWLAGRGSVHIPAQCSRTAILDLEDYVCAYPEMLVSGGKGTRIRLQWAEGLFLKADGEAKGQRDEIEGKFFHGGVGDEFLLDGGEKRLFTTLWWEAGRYLELTLSTGSAPLVLESLRLRKTGYPLKMEGSFESSEKQFSLFLPIAERAMQMCSHETYMDCPYYEQLMYVGDTRLEVLTTYAMTPDVRLPRKALLMFDWSRRNSGFTQSRYPSRVCQIIPPFSLWWICMVHDYWLWRDDTAFVKERMPGVRAVAEAFRNLLRPDGLMDAPNGWNFSDWVKEPSAWDAGVPPGAEFSPSAVLNLHFALTLLHKAEIEESFGERQLAERDRATASMLTDAVVRVFWDKEKGLIADDAKHEFFSEHAQCLALLGGLLDGDKRGILGDSLSSARGLSKTTIYFSHYLFEVCRLLRKDELFFERLKLWFQLPAHGFKTTFERPEPSRSDCHAWGAHPLFHCYATILGIRPNAPGFRGVRIAPMPGSLKKVSGTLPHPQGELHVSLERARGVSMKALVSLPAGIDGSFVWEGEERPLSPGENILDF